ncbi:polyprenyl synthetase family protein [Desulfoluna sp.]|uniref:polyprenyl synthetase family protein n=1 Tax=Desulfoluna sp. TaxID=2045199 RepID=UPI00262A7C14|nr:polyprenyl synthetase family protein [Desulfoluna sp.]
MSDLKAKILGEVAGELSAIETALKENLNPWAELAGEVAGHLLFSGGKRLRPLLMILAARACGSDRSDLARYSVLFEYLHAATLIHDDLVDEAVMRRGKPAAHAVYGAPEAVLTGDFILARCLTLTAETRNFAIIDEICGITEAMSQGEIQQLYNKGRMDLTEAEYLEVIERKTAVLLKGACVTGALLAGQPEEGVDAMGRYGWHIGMAFQMADDLLDYTADLSVLGKEPGADLREGKLTLPVIHALSKASDEEKLRMEVIMTDLHFTEDAFSELVAMLEKLNGIGYTQGCAADHVAKAKAALGGLPESREKELLLLVGDYSLGRKS